MDRRHAVVGTSLGELTLVAHEGTLVGLYYPQHWYLPAESKLGGRVDASCDAVLDRARTELGEYLAGRRTRFDVVTATHGDGFQERVWALLNDIPFGETTTYGALAEKLGDRRLARAVGGAVGRNPISVLIPCHRVVGSKGELTGYAGGLARKHVLLDLEATVRGEVAYSS